MPKNIDRRFRRRQAILSAAGGVLTLLLPGLTLLVLRRVCCPTGWGSTVLLVLAIASFALLLPLFITLRQRLQEIEGGEEDEACQY